MTYIFKASPQFWRSFKKLPAGQQKSAKDVFQNTFKKDPFHPSLRTHKIEKLSARYKRTILSATIEGNLRTVFYREGSVIKTVDIGDHDIYK